MTYQDREQLKCDVLIVGSGIAGALAAYELASKNISVVLACKAQLLDSNTAWAQGGLAAVTDANPLDQPELHLKDTLSSGAGLTDARMANRIIEGGQHLVNRLSELGVEFDRKEGSNKFDVALEGGHSHSRVLHSKDASGRAIALSLVEALKAHPGITLLENTFALDLIVDEGVCTGAHVILPSGELAIIDAANTILATGGLGQVFSRTTNPDVATGDGIAMAYRAGARLADMEFIQFHPTALVREGAPAALISEAIRGAGAHLLDRNNERFAFRFHKDGELATRDIVARAIYSTMMEQQLESVWLDLRPIGSATIERKFPNIVTNCRRYGIDPVLHPIPVAPAAHYFMGGIWVDEFGQSSLPGLFAIGECSSTGLHGANRLASNSLLEGGVMAMQIANFIAGRTQTARKDGTNRTRSSSLVWLQAPFSVLKQIGDFKTSMFESVGLERNGEQLQTLLSRLPEMLEYKLPMDRANAESANLALLGWLIARSALERKESRGAHWRSDYPKTNDTVYRKRLCMTRQEGTFWIDVASSAPDTVPAVRPAAALV